MKNDSNGQPQGVLDIIRDILVKEFNIDDDRVLIYDQDTDLPKDAGLFLLVEASGDPRVIANRNVTTPTEDGMIEEQYVNIQQQIVVSVMSQNNEAMYRRWEVPAALKSVYAQQIQELQGFKIFTSGQSIDLSGQEGGSMLKRYDFSFMTFAWFSKKKAIGYFDKFSAEISTENQVGIDVKLSN